MLNNNIMETKTDNNSPEEKSSLDSAMASVKEEPLGSLTVSDFPELKGQQLRSSARVFKKMKLDTAPVSIPEPEKVEKKEENKQDTKKCIKPLWSSEDKTLFFEALNDYGKDFESIHLYITNKKRKKGITDHFTKDQVRHLYSRTWNKISKYLKFADGIKRPTQELYGLINYGEFRKKLSSINEKYKEKYLPKLNRLVYKGSVMLRIKGKNIRVTTPFCRALRRLNQLDDKYEEITLPNRLNVELRPKDMTSFLTVQSTAQNPRLKTSMPLQKRLSSLIECVSKKWRSIEAEMYEKALISTSPVTSSCIPSESEIAVNRERLNPLLRVTPPADCKIDLPSINLGEYFTRQSICFNSHQTRLGISNYNSYCNYSTYKLIKGSKKGTRPRADSVSEKVDKSQQKNNLHSNDENSMETDSTTTELNKDGSNKDSCKENGKNVNGISKQDTSEGNMENVKTQDEDNVNNGQNPIDLEKQERINKIRKGWTEKDAASITLGEMYLMFGQNSKLILEYSWDPVNTNQVQPETDAIKTEVQLKSPPMSPSKNLDLSKSLLKLISVAKLHYRKNMIKCPCGHVCGTKTNAQLKKDVETKIRKILTDIDKCSDEQEEKIPANGDQHIVDNENGNSFVTPQGFLPPKIPINPYFQNSTKHLASQIASIQRLSPRYCNRKGRRPRSKQVVVERQLPLLPNNIESGHQIVRMNIISKEDSNPPPPKPAVDTSSSSSSSIFIAQSSLSSSTNFIVQPNEVLAETLKVPIDDLIPSSPSRILKEEHWINSEVGDYSLSSLLGHLESPVKSGANLSTDDSRISQDVDAQLRSMLAQNSIDFSDSFADLAAEVARDTKCELG